MNEKKELKMIPICAECREENPTFEISYADAEITIKGKHICYQKKVVHCHKCGSVMFVAEVHNENLKTINQLYKKVKHNSISVKWDITDVQSHNIRPDLTNEQAYHVLETVQRKHDANIGINWDIIKDWANALYPEKE